jgi:hypothetical protein
MAPCLEIAPSTHLQGGNQPGYYNVGRERITMQNAAPTAWRYPVNTIYLTGWASLRTYAACLRILDVLVDPWAPSLSPTTSTESVTIDIQAAGNGRNCQTTSVIQLHVSREKNAARTATLPPVPLLQLSPNISLEGCPTVTLGDIFQLQSQPNTAAFLTYLTVSLRASETSLVLALEVVPAARMYVGTPPCIFDVYHYVANFSTFETGMASGVRAEGQR